MSNQLQVREEQGQLAPMRSLDQLMQIAEMAVSRGWCQEGETAEDVALRMLKGQDEGLTPMQALEHVYLPSAGKPASDSKVLVAKYEQAGHSYVIDEWTETEISGRFILADGTDHAFALTRAECDKYGWSKTRSGKTKFASFSTLSLGS